jgi:hypothetical protein
MGININPFCQWKSLSPAGSMQREKFCGWHFRAGDLSNRGPAFAAEAGCMSPFASGREVYRLDRLWQGTKIQI